MLTKSKVKNGFLHHFFRLYSEKVISVVKIITYISFSESFNRKCLLLHLHNLLWNMENFFFLLCQKYSKNQLQTVFDILNLEKYVLVWFFSIISRFCKYLILKFASCTVCHDDNMQWWWWWYICNKCLGLLFVAGE